MFEKELEEMKIAAELARNEILKIYSQDFDVEIKSDDSPVTEADKKEYAADILSTYCNAHFFLIK